MMELFWYIVLLVMLTIYFILDGYDFGAGVVYLFFAKTEAQKKSILNAIGPFWDANEVWLIAAGGVLFFAFPTLYSSVFSGFYLMLMLVLWLLIFRAIGLELRGQVKNKLWTSVWDVSFGAASSLLALAFGVALGNIVRGVNLGHVVNDVATYEPHFFFLPFWNSSFSPLATKLGAFDWFTLLMGILSAVTLTIHGANWVIFRTNTDLSDKLKKIVFNLNFGLLVLVVSSLVVWHIIVPDPFQNYSAHPFLWLFPIITLIGLFGLFGVKKYRHPGTGFLFSSLFLIGGFTSTAVSIFPSVLPSTNDVNPDLTIYNTAAHEYGLSVGVYWYVIAIVLVVVYLFIQYSIFKRGADGVDYGGH